MDVVKNTEDFIRAAIRIGRGSRFLGQLFLILRYTTTTDLRKGAASGSKLPLKRHRNVVVQVPRALCAGRKWRGC